MSQGNIEDQLLELLKRHMGLSFTLFGLAEMQGTELLELFNSILHAISDQQPEKIGTEKIEATVGRMSEFLRVLKFPFPVAPEEWDVRLGKGDPKLIQPAMHWLLKDFEANKKQAYIAKYTEDVQIPEEVKVEPTVAELVTQHREIIEQFQEKYAELQELGESSVDQLRKQITDLEADKARLTTKVNAFKRKLANTKNIDVLLEWTAKLRIENDKDIQLSQQLARLTDEKDRLTRQQQSIDARVKNARSTLENRLQTLRSEITTLKSVGGPSPNATSEEKSLILAQQQVISASKRLSQQKQTLESLQAKRTELESELQKKQSDGSIEVPGPTEFQAYIRMLKNKNETYKSLQAEYSTLNKELSTLFTTQAITEQQAKEVHDEVTRIAKERGVSGVVETRARLEEVSAAKADADSLKDKTLEEMTDIVKEIQRQIQARKNELKPFVAQLQEVRKQKAAIESKYLNAKGRYQKAISEYDGVCMELDEECKKLRTDIATYQSKYHNIQQLMAKERRLTQRAKKEQEAMDTGNPISKHIKTFADYFQKQGHKIRKETKALKEQKQALGNESETNQQQLDLFQNLRQMLQVKLESQKKEAQVREETRAQEKVERQTVAENLDLRADGVESLDL